MNKKEKKELVQFIDSYKQIETTIALMQKSIESLAEKRNTLLNDLELLKNREEEFMNTLIQKYGASQITPHKLLKIYESTK